MPTSVPLLPRVVAVLVFAGVVTGIGAVARIRYLPEGETLPGLRIDGEAIADGADLRATVELRVAELRARKVRLVAGSAEQAGWPTAARPLAELTLGDLGLEVDVDAVVERARAVGHTGDLLTRVELADRARRGEIDVPLLPRINPSVVVARLEPLKEEEDVAPVSARLDLEHHTVIGEKDGRYLDLDAAATLLQHVAETQSYVNEPVTTIGVPTAPFTPRISSAFLKSIAISEVLSTFETTFGRNGGQANRARNVEVAASRINGVVLYPGDVVSFNAVVGARSEENGFHKAGEIFKGEMIEGVGGGTCQVASTFYAAAFFGGLDVVERLPHSRPSAYIPLGLDATVVYPSVDLKLKNPHPFPIVVHAFIDGNKVKVELLGREKPVVVSFGKEVLGTFPFARKVVEDGSVTAPKVKQRGIKGVQLRRSRVLAYADGQRRVETSMDMYPPTTEIYRVPPGYNPDELPPVGEDPNASVDGAKKPDANPQQG